MEAILSVKIRIRHVELAEKIFWVVSRSYEDGDAQSFADYGEGKYICFTARRFFFNLCDVLQGNIAKWHKKVGDTIKPGDVLCAIETDKATIDYEMQDEGYVAKLLHPDGTKDLPLGTVLAIVVDDEDDIAAFADYTDDGGAAATPAAASTPEPAAAATSA